MATSHLPIWHTTPGGTRYTKAPKDNNISQASRSSRATSKTQNRFRFVVYEKNLPPRYALDTWLFHQDGTTRSPDDIKDWVYKSLVAHGIDPSSYVVFRWVTCYTNINTGTRLPGYNVRQYLDTDEAVHYACQEYIAQIPGSPIPEIFVEFTLQANPTTREKSLPPLKKKRKVDSFIAYQPEPGSNSG